MLKSEGQLELSAEAAYLGVQKLNLMQLLVFRGLKLTLFGDIL